MLVIFISSFSIKVPTAESLIKAKEEEKRIETERENKARAKRQKKNEKKRKKRKEIEVRWFISCLCFRSLIW